MANKQIVGDCRIYSQHSRSCSHKREAAFLKCNCKKWLQWLEGGKIVRRSAGVRSEEQIRRAAEAKTRELRGEVAAPPVVTLKEVTKNWLAHRAAESRGNEKAQTLAKKFIDWCAAQDIVNLNQITTPLMNNFFTQMGEWYAKGNSSSLKIHWSIVRSFFIWATEGTSPLMKENPALKKKIKVTKSKIVPPTTEEVKRVIAAAEGTTKLFIQVMRFSGMAIRDTATLSRDKLTGNIIKGKRTKTNESYRVMIPQFLADALVTLPGQYFFWDGKTKPSSVAHLWEKRLGKVFEIAKVSMTPHGFRHHFVTEQFGLSTPLDAVSRMVGTSPAELRKTYQHESKDEEEWLDKCQQRVFEQRGMDQMGNPVTIQ